MNTAELNQLIDSYVSLDEEIKSLERKRDRMKEQIIALGEGAHRANVGAVSVTLGERRTLDQAKVKEALGDAIEDFYKTSVAITVRVTVFKD